jgi:nucleotide-binding universal stress UspA family protein
MYSHILIATDGSELATKGLDQGLSLAKALGSMVTIVTVTETWHMFEIAKQVE